MNDADMVAAALWFDSDSDLSPSEAEYETALYALGRMEALIEELTRERDSARYLAAGPLDHSHPEYVEGCFRCDLSRDEVEAMHAADIEPRNNPFGAGGRDHWDRQDEADSGRDPEQIAGRDDV